MPAPTDVTKDEVESVLYGILSQPRVHLALVIFLFTVLAFSQLSLGGLPTYDDCYYAQKAKEILQTGDWLTMRTNGIPRFDNPPLFMWLVALSFQVFGVNEFAARLPSALLGLVTVVLTYFFARRLSGPWAGFYSAFVLSTTLLFVRYSRRAMTDVTLTFFVTLALFALFLGVNKDRRYFLLWGGSIAGAVLTKSVLGLLPLGVTVLFLCTTGKGRLLLDRWFYLGVALAAVLSGSWYLHQYWSFGPAFLQVHFGWLIVGRSFFLEPQPWHARFYYLRELGVHYWPWLPLLLFGLLRWARSWRRKDEGAYLLVLWLATYLLGLSIPQARVVWYMLPIFPAAAMICGSTAAALLSDRKRVLVASVGAAAVATVLALLVLNATSLRISPSGDTDVRALAPYVKLAAENGASVVAFRQTYHSLNNPLLFYSGHAAEPVFETAAELSAVWETPQSVVCIANRSELDALSTQLSNVRVLHMTERLALIANQPLPTSAGKM